MELCEYSLTANCDDGSAKDNNPCRVYLEHLRESLRKMGRPVPGGLFMKSLLEKAGFEDVKMMDAKELIGPWPKDPTLKKVGAMVLLNAESAFESYAMAAFTRVLGMEEEKAREICEAGCLAYRNKNYHIYGL
jgi:hypothetical protein